MGNNWCYKNKLPQIESPLDSLEKKRLVGTKWVVPGCESPGGKCFQHASSHAPASKKPELV